jgi:hypothetical protein
MNICRKSLTRTVIAVAAIAVLGMPTASASQQGDLWNMANRRHIRAGCAPYVGSPEVEAAALKIAQTMTLINTPGSFPINNPPSADSLLADRGYYVTAWGQANYINSASAGSPRAAMNFWMENSTRAIFSNCDMKNMATAVWIQNGKWAAVVVAASPGGTPGKPPVVN